MKMSENGKFSIFCAFQTISIVGTLRGVDLGVDQVNHTNKFQCRRDARTVG